MSQEFQAPMSTRGLCTLFVLLPFVLLPFTVACGSSHGNDRDASVRSDGGGRDGDVLGDGAANCGELVCPVGSRCCSGCGGSTACVADTLSCPRIACDGGQTKVCGDDTCGVDSECCTTCEGGAYCTPPGEQCPDIACLGCGSEICGDDEVCCVGCGVATCEPASVGCPPTTPQCPVNIQSCEEAIRVGAPDGTPCSGEWSCNAPPEMCCTTSYACVAGQIGTSQICGDCGPMCVSNEQCLPVDFCSLEACGGVGQCSSRPENCPGVYAPVCGCDGLTYSNDCVARSEGVSVLSQGECPPPSCAPQDAHGDGPCAAIVGIFWNGSECVWESGCNCVGADCGNAYPTIESCEAAHRSCLTSCGGFAGNTCTPEQFCDFAGDICDWADDVGVCRRRPNGCDTLYAPVCGCNEMTYSNLCIAQAAGFDAAYDGECAIPDSQDPTPTPAPMPR